MMALVVAQPGLVCDGLVALLGAIPDVHSIVQIPQAADAWDFVQLLNPDITVIHANPLTQELATLIFQMKQSCHFPLLVIINSKVDWQTADAQGADIIVMEGLPSIKLATHIATLLQQYLKTEAVEASGQES